MNGKEKRGSASVHIQQDFTSIITCSRLIWHPRPDQVKQQHHCSRTVPEEDSSASTKKSFVRLELTRDNLRTHAGLTTLHEKRMKGQAMICANGIARLTSGQRWVPLELAETDLYITWCAFWILLTEVIHAAPATKSLPQKKTLIVKSHGSKRGQENSSCPLLFS